MGFYKLKVLVAGCHSFCLFFIFFSLTYIHSFNHSHSIHLSFAIRWGLSPFPHRLYAQWGNTSLWCRAENRTRACLTASRRATNWATPHHQLSHAAPYNWATSISYSFYLAHIYNTHTLTHFLDPKKIIYPTIYANYHFRYVHCKSLLPSILLYFASVQSSVHNYDTQVVVYLLMRTLHYSS